MFKGTTHFGTSNLEAEVGSAFEHQVLQVMGQSRCLGRVVARSCAHGDVRLDAGLLVVDAQIDRQTVFQRVDTGLHRVVGHTLVSVALGRGCRSQRQQSCGEQGAAHSVDSFA